jgi:hypothetical protein
MLVVACLVGMPMCYILPHIILVTLVLGRMLESLHHALFAKSGVNHGSRLTCLEFVSLGDPSRRMFDDGAGMHEYWLSTISGLR